MEESIAQRPSTQQPPHIKASKHDAMADAVNNSVRRHVASPLGLDVADAGLSKFRK